MTGGKIIFYTFQIHHNLKQDIGITIKPFEDQEGTSYNYLNIEGTPKYKENYHIKITGGIYGSGDGQIEKEYILTIKD